MSGNRIGLRHGAMVSVLLLVGSDAWAWQRALQGGEGDQARWAHSGQFGPEQWAGLAPEFAACGNGQGQSPISIPTAASISAPCDPLRFRYRSSSLYVTNDGRALRLGYDRGSFVLIDGLSYELVELRFHVPGEHAFDGRVPDGELQLIHGNNRGDVAIIAVPLRSGRRVNQILRRVLEHAPSVADKQFYGRNVGVNALFLLPGRKDYFAYRGSLTRPPCTEDVRWYVLKTPLEVEAGDLRRLAQIVGPNARPLQPLAGREVVSVCEP